MRPIVKSKSNIRNNRLIGPVGGGSAIGDIELIQDSQAKASGEKPKGHIGGNSGNARIASNNNGTFTISDELENTPTPTQTTIVKSKSNIRNNRIASSNNGTFNISDGLENTSTPTERKIGRAVKSEIKNASGAFGGGRIASNNNGTFTISDGLENTPTPNTLRKGQNEVVLSKPPLASASRKGQNEVVLSKPPLASASRKVDALTIKQNSRLVGLPGSNSALGTTTVGPTGNTTINNTGIVFSNTKFNRSLNLENRLQQVTTAGSTSNLAQYYLSDTHTKYLRITPFGIFTHTSPVTIAEWIFVPIQGGLEPEPFEFNSLFYQGVIIKNGEIVSISPTETPRENIITLQGAIPYGNGFISIVGAQITIPPQNVQQGGNVQVQTPTSVDSMALEQGVIQQPNGGLGSATNISVPDSEIDIFEAPPRHGITEVKPFNFQPNVVGVTPQVLRYSGDRALAYFAPRIKHGSVYVDKGSLPDYYDTSYRLDSNSGAQGNFTTVRYLDSDGNVENYNYLTTIKSDGTRTITSNQRYGGLSTIPENDMSAGTSNAPQTVITTILR